MVFMVHGATGAQGSPVLANLHALGAPALAAVRHTESVPDGIDSVRVDLEDAHSLITAYSGADGVFVHLPLAAPEQLAAYAHSIGTAVAAARPRRVVISTSGQIVDQPGAALQSPEGSPIMTLIREVEASGVSSAVVASRLYLENLLLPVVSGPAREEGILRYPLPAAYPVSWSSHLDVADAAVRLLTDDTHTGTVGIGHLPGLTGGDLAAGFADRLGTPMRYEPLTPETFGELITPLFGADAAAPVVNLYRALNAQHENVIARDTSAQHLLGLVPRPVTEWLGHIAP